MRACIRYIYDCILRLKLRKLQKRTKENGPGGGLQQGNIELTVSDDEQGPFDAGGGGGGGVPKMPGWGGSA